VCERLAGLEAASEEGSDEEEQEATPLQVTIKPKTGASNTSTLVAYLGCA